MLQGGGVLRGRLWPGLCARWRLSTALFRGMPDRFPFSVPGGLFVRRPSFPFRFRPSFPGLPFRIVISLVFSQPVGAPSFPCLPGFHLNIYEVFSCVASCASSVLSLCVPSVPVSSPFCNPCSPLHFSVPIRSVAPVRLPCFPCVRLLSSSIHLSLPPPRASSFFTAFALLFFIFPLCTAPDTCPIFSLRAFRPGTSSSLSSFLPFFLRPWAFRSPCAFSVFSLCVFSASLPPPSRCHSPFFPAAFPSSSSFVPAFSFPYSPLLSSPSFSIKKKVPS